MPLAPATNGEPHGVTLAGYCYAMKHGMEVLIVTPYRVSHLQRYGDTVRGNVTSVYPPLHNTEASSFSHCCSEKANSITYSERVYVALGIVICGLAGSAIFFHIIS
jgi:hypothetical protein